MPDEVTTAQLAALISEGGPFSAGSSLTGDEIVASISELLRQTAHPEYVTVMVSESQSFDYSGVDGFREAWEDWMSPYQAFRVELDEVIRLEDKVVFLVRQIATTRHSSVEVTTPSATVWWLEDAQIRKAAFYLDRQAGLEAAGMAPPDRPPAA